MVSSEEREREGGESEQAVKNTQKKESCRGGSVEKQVQNSKIGGQKKVDLFYS